MLPDELKTNIGAILSKQHGQNVSIIESRAIGGGCINEAFALTTTKGKFFVKYNRAKAFPQMFETEAQGLKILSETSVIGIPEVIAYSETDHYAFLLLEYIENGNANSHFWSDFGTKLANLHSISSSLYGLDFDNYIGSLKQINRQHNNFIEFFVLNRLELQWKECRDKGFFSQSDQRHFDSLIASLHNIIPIEKPALIHGDLWNGNFMVSSTASPFLIDPAIYFGHRESDIAMSKLFGGFDPRFYEAYNDMLPLEKGWQSRLNILNLYPLLVHVNLFGGGYANQVLQLIRQF